MNVFEFRIEGLIGYGLHGLKTQSMLSGRLLNSVRLVLFELSGSVLG